jgi:hypothetical protein
VATLRGEARLVFPAGAPRFNEHSIPSSAVGCRRGDRNKERKAFQSERVRCGALSDGLVRNRTIAELQRSTGGGAPMTSAQRSHSQTTMSSFVNLSVIFSVRKKRGGWDALCGADGTMAAVLFYYPGPPATSTRAREWAAVDEHLLLCN